MNKKAAIIVTVGIIAVGLTLLALSQFWPPPTRAASIESIGTLHDPLNNTTQVTPGKYEVTLPFTLKNLTHDPTVYNVRLEPGQENTIFVVIYEIGQGSLQVQLMPKIEIR